MIKKKKKQAYPGIVYNEKLDRWIAIANIQGKRYVITRATFEEAKSELKKLS